MRQWKQPSPSPPPSLSETTSVLLSAITYSWPLECTQHRREPEGKGRANLCFTKLILKGQRSNSEGHTLEQTLAPRLLPVNKAAWSWGYIWWLGRDIQPGISSLLVHPLALAACSWSAQDVNILLLSLCQTSKLLLNKCLILVLIYGKCSGIIIGVCECEYCAGTSFCF